MIGLFERWRNEQERREYGHALLAALYVNAHAGDKQEPRQPEDFMRFAARRAIKRPEKLEGHIVARKAALSAKGIKVK